ncbi:ribonuclease Oy-like [Crassostrea angulata]|uniref:ribonuclease Oy-like n=1 Tax=Magallana angulata TaxID=2784310 RepID=UPI0022B0A1E0|nr:ribonuclease Oy-like [Crassostrea angulata]
MDTLFSQGMVFLVLLLLGSRYLEANEAKQFDYFTLALQWPISYCKIHSDRCNLDRMPEVWTIHGLWPSNESKQNRPVCCNNNFDAQQIPQNVRESLKLIWPNLNTDENDTKFWAQQWWKHGSCASKVNGVENISNYFSKAIELARTYNITEILKNSGITTGKCYLIENVQCAMMNRTGKTAKISWTNASCAPGWLSEIWICFDKTFDVIDCPNASMKCPIIKYSDKDDSQKTPCTNVTNSVRNNYCSPHRPTSSSSNYKMVLLGTLLVIIISTALGFIIYAYQKKWKTRPKGTAKSDNSRLLKSDGNELQLYTM